VAEFADNNLTTAQFAWVIAYLCGAYGPCTFNLEINGPGQAVLNELQNMKKEKVFGTAAHRPILKDVMGSMRDFIYRKYDSIYGSAGGMHTQTTFQMKERMMNNMRDYVERGMAEMASKDLLDEMHSIVRENGSAPAASDNAHDDRVIAACLALLAWNDQVRTKLMSMGVLRETERQLAIEETLTGHQAAGPRLVKNYMKQLGILYNKQDALASNIRLSKGHRYER
jgi:hypothetical protein